MEQATAAAGHGPSDDPQLALVGSLDEVRLEATRIARSAQRLLTVHTHGLEPDLYAHPPFLNAVKRLVLGRRYAKVRVLIVEPARIQFEHNPFIALARKLTSYIEIRHADRAHRCDPSSYLVADDGAFLCRPNQARWEGIAHLRATHAARAFLDRFDVAWDASAPARARTQARA